MVSVMDERLLPVFAMERPTPVSMSHPIASQSPEQRFKWSPLVLITVMGMTFHSARIPIPMSWPLVKSIRSRAVLVIMLMPNDRTAPHIERAIKSVLHQTMLDLEVVFSDDMSTDRSDIFLSSLMISDSRIRLFIN
jgi:hypothetical protein